jgi:hypothetical protein
VCVVFQPSCEEFLLIKGMVKLISVIHIMQLTLVIQTVQCSASCFNISIQRIFGVTYNFVNILLPIEVVTLFVHSVLAT